MDFDFEMHHEVRRVQREAVRYLRFVWLMLFLSIAGGVVLSAGVVAVVVYLILHFWG